MTVLTTRDHWTARAVGMHADYSDNPLWGHVAQDDYGDLLLPSWRNPMPARATGGWWGRSLNLRNPLHWLPYLRSRLTGRCASIDTGDWS